jgi:hypothetical protein
MRMTTDEWKTTQEFQGLAPAWQKFLLEYLKDSDSARAAREAYPRHGNPAVCGASLLRRYQIQRALDRYYGRPALDRVLDDLHLLIRQHLRASRGQRKISDNLIIALKFYAELGGRKPFPLEGTPLENLKSQEQSK